jgi:hypothetical protein
MRPLNGKDVRQTRERMTEAGSQRSESHESLWGALRSADPVASLTRAVKGWKVAGCTQAEAERRLTIFLEEVMANGAPDEDDPVRDVLDFVVGYCSGPMKIFP